MFWQIFYFVLMNFPYLITFLSEGTNQFGKELKFDVAKIVIIFQTFPPFNVLYMY